MRKLLIAGGIAALALLPALPAAAHQDHRSCAGFGLFASGFAQTGQLGKTVSTAAQSGPGVVAANTAHEHETYCSP